MFKSYPAKVKAAEGNAEADGDLAEGQFRAVVSVFGNVDSYGDVVAPGAFAATLADWSERQARIPIYWSHQLDDPDMNVGYVVEATETDVGLEVLGQLDLEGGGKALQVHRLMKGDRVNEFSFSYDVLDGGPVEKDGESYNELRALKLYELGPTAVGANPATELLAVKRAAVVATAQLAADAKAGRVLSSKNEGVLRDVVAALADSSAQIKNVLAALDPEDGKANHTQQEASAEGPAKDEEPHAAKSEEPSPFTSAKTWEAELSLLTLGATP